LDGHPYSHLVLFQLKLKLKLDGRSAIQMVVTKLIFFFVYGCMYSPKAGPSLSPLGVKKKPSARTERNGRKGLVDVQTEPLPCAVK
jgi:hypothetical protein